MTIYQITTEEKKDLINFAIENKFKDHEELINNYKTMSGSSLDINLINQRIEFINSYDYFVINREAFANEDRQVLQMFKSIISFMRNTKPIFIWEGINEDYKKELIKEGIKNLICGETYEEQKEEILESFSEKGMQRYNTNWKTSGEENYEKYVFKEERPYYIQVLTTDNMIRCRSMALSLSMYINKIGGKVGFIAPFLSNDELKSIGNIIEATIQQNEEVLHLIKENIELSNDYDFINNNKGKYNFIIQDLGFIDEGKFSDYKEDIVNEIYDKNVIICDLNEIEVENIKKITKEMSSKTILINSLKNYIKIDDLSSIDKEYFSIFDKNNKIKKFEMQEDIIDIRTNRNLFYGLIEQNIVSTKVE